ncbi:MAG: hypothetical protein R3D03_05750 [Geminicoccaceae bacterium]
MLGRLDQDALEYHCGPVAGKLEVTATKPLATQRDLSLAYSPGGSGLPGHCRVSC